MERLDSLILDFAKVEYGIEALLIVLNSLGEIYDMKKEEDLKASLNVVIRQLDSLKKELGEYITSLDLWVLNAKKE